MAEENSQLFCMGRDGVPFTVHIEADTAAAAGVYCNLDMNQQASTTSPQDIIVPKDCWITDLVMPDDLTGVYEIISNGRKTGIFFTQAMHVATSSGRPALRIPLARGTQFRLQVTTAPSV